MAPVQDAIPGRRSPTGKFNTERPCTSSALPKHSRFLVLPLVVTRYAAQSSKMIVIGGSWEEH